MRDSGKVNMGEGVSVLRIALLYTVIIHIIMLSTVGVLLGKIIETGNSGRVNQSYLAYISEINERRFC